MEDEGGKERGDIGENREREEGQQSNRDKKKREIREKEAEIREKRSER